METCFFLSPCLAAGTEVLFCSVADAPVSPLAESENRLLDEEQHADVTEDAPADKSGELQLLL